MECRLFLPPPGLQLPSALESARQVSDCLLHPLAAQSLRPLLAWPTAADEVRVAALTLREAAACLTEAMPDWARGASVARPWQDGRQARMQPSSPILLSFFCKKKISFGFACKAAVVAAKVRKG